MLLTADDKRTLEDNYKTGTLRLHTGQRRKGATVGPHWQVWHWEAGGKEGQGRHREEMEGRGLFEELFRRQIMPELRHGGRGRDTKVFPRDPNH